MAVIKNRGVQDGLAGFKEAIGAVFPQAQIQRCVIHMLRNSFKYINYIDLKKFSSDFKAVYNAPNEIAALSEPEGMKEKWGKINSLFIKSSDRGTTKSCVPVISYSFGIYSITRHPQSYS